MTINPQYLWQVGMVASSGTATVTGTTVDITGVTRRFSISVTTTAKTLKTLLTNAGVWRDDLKGIIILTVVTADIYLNLGGNADGTFEEAPTSANEKISAADYSTSPLSITVRAA